MSREQHARAQNRADGARTSSPPPRCCLKQKRRSTWGNTRTARTETAMRGRLSPLGFSLHLGGSSWHLNEDKP